MSNAVLVQIRQVLGNLVRTLNISQTYVDKYELWMGNLSAAAFVIFSTTNWQKGYSMGLLIFGCDMILLIENTLDWELIRQRKQTQITKDNIRKIDTKMTTTLKTGSSPLCDLRSHYLVCIEIIYVS